MKKKKDILFLCQFFYPEYVSSATLPFDTAEALVKAGHTVDVLCGYPKEYNDKSNILLKENYQGIGIERVKYLQMDRRKIWGRLINYVSFTFAVMIKIKKLARYQIIFVYSNPPVLPIVAVWAKKLFNTKIVFISYDVYPEIAIQTKVLKENSIISDIFCSVNKLLFKNVEVVVALSQDMKKLLCEKRSISANKVIVIPTWYKDVGRIQQLTTFKHTILEDIPENAFIISYLGNLGTCQELSTLLGVIRQVQKDDVIHFVFAGHGNKFDLLKKIVKDEKLENVHIYNFLKGKDYLDILGESDIFIFTLIQGLEGLCSPSKVCSYLMSGKPVLGIIDEGMELAIDIRRKGCGFIIEPGNINKLKRFILELKENEGLKKEYGENARKLFLQKYEKEICLEKYVFLVKKICENYEEKRVINNQ